MKRFIAICLIVMLFLGAFPLSALAAGNSAASQFTDVRSDAWYVYAVSYVFERNLMRGMNARTFAPEANISRAMVVSVLYRMAGAPAVNFRPAFRDVSAGQWYSEAVIWAYDNAIVRGTSTNIFSPHADITREELAVMVRGYYIGQMQNADVSVRQGRQWNSFSDRGQISPWAQDSLTWANYHDIIGGRTATSIAPGGTATRAEAAMIFMRFVETFSANVSTPPPPQPPQPQMPNPPAQIPPDASAFEWEVFLLINQERTSRGIRPLEWHSGVATVARNHSMDMANRTFFAHVCPSGIRSWSRVENAGISFQRFAENLSLGRRTPQAVMEGLMNSPGHMENVLNPSMTHVGVGFYLGQNRVPGQFYSAMPYFWTQKFIRA